MSDKFNKIYQESINSPEKFWQEASNDIFWFKKPNKILNKSKPPFYRWFEDGTVARTRYEASVLPTQQAQDICEFTCRDCQRMLQWENSIAQAW